VIVIIDSTIETDLVIEWDMNNNTETNSYDVGKTYDIFFDSRGEIITAKADHYIFNGTIMKAYNIDKHTFDEESHELGRYHGHRFDHKNHNWIIKKQYMSLGFSYMGFVIKKQLEESIEPVTNRFDIEAYNYIFNRSTAFLDSEFVSENHIILEQVLHDCL